MKKIYSFVALTAFTLSALLGNTHLSYAVSTSNSTAGNGSDLYVAPINGGYSQARCHNISVEQDFDALTSEVTCKGNENVGTYKVDCGNGTIVLLPGGVKEVKYTCLYDDPDTEYIAECSISRAKTEEAFKVDTSVFSCDQRYTFDPEIERQRAIFNARIRESDSYTIIDDSIGDNPSNDGGSDSDSGDADKLADDLFADLIDVYDDYIADKDRLDDLIKDSSSTKENNISGYPSVLPKTGTPDSLSKVKNEKLRQVVELDTPEYVGELAGNYTDDINFWKGGVVEEDRNRNTYVVVPSTGLVIPINTIEKGTEYYDDMSSGEEININEYLQDGAAVYAGTETEGFGEVGNPVIYGHSSYWKNQPGRYKTHFQTLIGLDTNTEIWVYEKNSQGSYDRHRYLVEKSYETQKDDFSTLDTIEGKNLTLMTCTPIGGTTGRWIVKATYIDEEREELARKIYGNNLTSSQKEMIDSVMDSLIGAEGETRKELIIEKYKMIDDLEESTSSQNILDFTKYLKQKLAIEYYAH